MCYIEREDRGAILSRVRLIGRQADDAWDAPRSDALSAPADASNAAAWIAERLDGRLGGRQLERLCLDVDGAVCSWVSASATEPAMLRAAIERDGAVDDADPFGESVDGGVGRFPDLPNEMGYQAIGVPAGQTRAKAAVAQGRAAVFAVPEVAARSVVDALDESGVQIESCISLWQAMASAWAPRNGSASADRIVADSSPMTAVVLCVPGERVVWAWIRGGVPIAAGSFRTRAGLGPSASEALYLEEPDASDNPQDAAPAQPAKAAFGGRLATDWLAWAAQMGAFPSRVTWVGPIKSDRASGIEPADIAEAVRTASPSASVDVIDDEDPIGLTLRRLAERLDDEPKSVAGADTQLVGLSNRPGRVHRAMYQWIAVLLLVLSAALVAVSWSFWQEREVSQQRLTEVRGNIRELVEAAQPSLINEPPDILPRKLRERLDAQRGPAPVDIPKPKPVLRELEALALVLGNPSYELESIDIGSFACTFTVRVEDALAFEQLQDSLGAIGGSSIDWNSLNPRPNREKINVNGTGTWVDRPAAGGAS